MDSVVEVLGFLGYDEICLRNGSWKPLPKANGSLGTTDETYLIQQDEPPRVRLRDFEPAKKLAGPVRSRRLEVAPRRGRKKAVSGPSLKPQVIPPQESPPQIFTSAIRHHTMNPVRRSFDTGSNSEQMNLFDGSNDPTPEGDARGRRAALSPPVRAVSLPRSFTAKINASSDALLERLLLTRAAYLNRRADETKLGTEKDSIRTPTSERSDFHARKRTGRATGALRGLTEDIWRRVFKRAVPRVKTGETDQFRELYKQVLIAAGQSDHIVFSPVADTKPAQPEVLGDLRGLGLPLSMELETAAQGRLPPTPPLFVRCTGPAPSGRRGIWANVERKFAHRGRLQASFTQAITAPQVDGGRRPVEGKQFVTQTRHSMPQGPQQMSIGRWRPDEARRPDRKTCAVRVPWMVADFDPPLSKGHQWCTRQVRRFLKLLSGTEVDLSDVVVICPGDRSVQIRIPDGVAGCPIYRDAYAAAYAIERFFDRVCSTDEVVRDEIDERLFHPDRLAPVIGSVDPATGRRVVGTDAETFLNRPTEALLDHPGQSAKYTQQEHCPSPREADFHWLPFLFLDPSRRDPDHKHAGGAIDGTEVGYLVRQSHSSYGEELATDRARSRPLNRLAGGVSQGEDWGTSIDPWYTGRNRAALFIAHDRLRAYENRERAWRSVKAWNRRNRPPLRENELRLMFEEAFDNWPGW